MSFLQDRFSRMFLTPTSLEELTQQIQDLRYTLNSAVQDIVVLKNVLEEKGMMDAGLYKRLRIMRMMNDRSSTGPSSWVKYSIYPYTLSEQDFLREALDANETEVKSFEEHTGHKESST